MDTKSGLKNALFGDSEAYIWMKTPTLHKHIHAGAVKSSKSSKADHLLIYIYCATSQWEIDIFAADFVICLCETF